MRLGHELAILGVLVTSRSPVEKIAFGLATGFGSGYSPFAPGTAGSVVGLVFAWLVSGQPLLGQIAALVVATGLAIWSADVVSKAVGRKDPGIVVSDEIAGVMLTMIAIPWTTLSAAAGFFLFRVMDVLKPPPARGFERFPGGWGIVADDLMAAVYAHLALRGVLFLVARAS